MEKSTQQLLRDFITNRCSAAELEKVQELIKAGIDEKEWSEALKQAEDYEMGHISLFGFDEEVLYTRIEEQLSIRRRKKSPLMWMGIAASLLLIAGLVWYQPWYPQNSFTKLNIPQVKSAGIGPKSGRQWIKLPDGSSVQLNEGSELNYPDSFDGQPRREVTLKGEAFFDIQHDPQHPFVIKTGKIRTTVLGTAFNIKAYKSDAEVVVTVSRGKVKVEDENHTLAILSPDQQLSWSPNNDVAAVKEKVKSSEVISWTKQDLIMDDITLDEASRLIEERFRVKVRFNNDQVKGCRFTAAFLNRNEIGQVLDVIGDITGARLQLKDNVVVIDGNGC